jgi:diaminopimelate decarboxylase
VLDGVQNTFRLVREVERLTGEICEVVNLGGGFGVAHGERDRELDLDALSRLLVPVLRDFQATMPAPRQIIFELGRFLTANAGIYVTRVVSSKDSRGTRFVVVDGGLHHHLAAAGTFGAALRSNYPLRNVSRPDAPQTLCSIAGPSCNPTDLLGIDVELARPEHGDQIAVLKSGSYGYTASPLLFLGRPTPAELVLDRGKILLGRRSRSMLDFN